MIKSFLTQNFIILLLITDSASQSCSHLCFLRISIFSYLPYKYRAYILCILRQSRSNHESQLTLIKIVPLEIIPYIYYNILEQNYNKLIKTEYIHLHFIFSFHKIYSNADMTRRRFLPLAENC